MLKIDKTDRRMNGHRDFKYRIKFDLHSFLNNDYSIEATMAAWNNANRAFLMCSKYMTETHGYGPELKLVNYMKENGEGVPLWATRHAYSVLHTKQPDTIYLRDDDAREKIEKVFVFLQLKYN